MSTSKYFDKIVCLVLCVALLLTVCLCFGEKLGITPSARAMGYETRLFDNSKVHSIDIVMDDWDGFIADCTDEEYVLCTVVIDGEAEKNVGLRAKGNTSLTNIANYGNDRYSFKIEFDHYDSTNTYHGLDKLCLNNIIQDNTYMKDYLCYTVMGEFGVASPLCSYAYITVNGEDFGLYLAVEGIEESFLERNYGSNYGELYKPDSQSMGGGRGNGKDFDGQQGEGKNAPQNESGTEQNDRPNPPENGQDSGRDGSFSPDGSADSASADSSDKMTPPDFQNSGEQGGFTPPNMQNSDSSDSADRPESGFAQKDLPDDFGGNEGGGMPQNGGDTGGMNGSSDVMLQYSDDSADSYPNIFDNAKTDPDDGDKSRLINSLKNLSEQTDPENTVDVESVIRYFVVHNFTDNFDSYTGSMIHNYYLYESDGVLSMIPWDYNLAFGAFGSSDAESLVNFPIDTPVSSGTVESRPMLSWIFSSEEYTNLYHELFSEFISKYFDGGYLEQLISDTKELISPYVEKDPTKFCTYEQFETGVLTLSEFCSLRAKSIKGQLGGTIPSTSDGQTADPSNLVSADGVNVSDMGSMGGGMGGNFQNGEGQNADFANGGPQSADASDSASQSDLNTGTASAAPDSPPSASTATESFSPPNS